MKKKILIMALIAIIALLAFIGCSKQESGTSTSSSGNTQVSKYLKEYEKILKNGEKLLSDYKAGKIKETDFESKAADINTAVKKLEIQYYDSLPDTSEWSDSQKKKKEEIEDSLNNFVESLWDLI